MAFIPIPKYLDYFQGLAFHAVGFHSSLGAVFSISEQFVWAQKQSFHNVGFCSHCRTFVLLPRTVIPLWVVSFQFQNIMLLLGLSYHSGGCLSRPKTIMLSLELSFHCGSCHSSPRAVYLNQRLLFLSGDLFFHDQCRFLKICVCIFIAIFLSHIFFQ